MRYALGGKGQVDEAEAAIKEARRIWKQAADVLPADRAFGMAKLDLLDVLYGAQTNCDNAVAERIDAKNGEATMTPSERETIEKSYLPLAERTLLRYCFPAP